MNPMKPLDEVVEVLRENGFLRSDYAVEQFKDDVLAQRWEIWVSNNALECKFIWNNIRQTHEVFNFRNIGGKKMKDLMKSLTV